MKNNLELIVAMGVVLCSPLYVMSSSSSSTAFQQNAYFNDLLKEGKNETELHEAVRSGSVERVSSVCRQLKSKSKLNKLNDNGSLAIIKSGGSSWVTLQKIPGFAPIHLAVLLKNPAIVEVLLSAGGDVNCLGGLPNLNAVVPPLYFMLVDQFFDPQMLQILLNQGAYFFYPVWGVGSGGVPLDDLLFYILTNYHPSIISLKDEECIQGPDIFFDCIPLLGPLIQNPLSQNNVQILVDTVIDTTREPIPIFDFIRRAPDRVMKSIAKKSYKLFAPDKKSLKSAFQRVRSFLKDRRKNSLFQNAELGVHIETLISSDNLSDDFALIILNFLTKTQGTPKDIFGAVDQKVIDTLLLSTSSQELVISFVTKKLKSTFEKLIAQHEKHNKKHKSWWRSANYTKILIGDRISFFDPTTVNQRYGALIKEGIEQRCSVLNSSLESTSSSVDTHGYDLDDALSSDDST